MTALKQEETDSKSDETWIGLITLVIEILNCTDTSLQICGLANILSLWLQFKMEI
jgi:hypothetical protein